MKAVILAGGLGTRLSEETTIKPKPMVEVGGKPVLWHILKFYSHYGINDFIICLGYKGYVIKEYFANYFLHHSDVTFNLRDRKTTVHENHTEPWSVTLVDTGDHTGTGGRLKRVAKYLDKEPFCFTYGDGLCNVDLHKLISFHNAHGKLATLTAVSPPSRYGAVEIGPESRVERFKEKPDGDDSWINGGYFILSPSVLNEIHGDEIYWERGPLESLSRNNELRAYRHNGFWLPMDTLRDKVRLEELWNSGTAPWKVWNN